MLNVEIECQPDDETCGPTSLQAVYRFFGDKVSLQQVMAEVGYLEEGGTLAVYLAKHAIKRGFHTRVYTYNLHVFDPSWFELDSAGMIKKLKAQMKVKKSKKLIRSTQAYIEYLSLGGELFLKDLTPELIQKYLAEGKPVLAGLNATYLWDSKREVYINNQSLLDDLKGVSMGHFVVLCGYDQKTGNVTVADPFKENPVSGDNYYTVPVTRVINAIMLGVLTYDANILVISPKAG